MTPTEPAGPEPADAPAAGGVALRLRGIGKSFPGTRALDDVDLDITYGRVTALIGENGAGKSTLMKVLSGVYVADEGTMELDGAHYAPRGPRDAAASGVVLVHQELSLLPNLSLAENIVVGRLPQRFGFVDRRRMNAQAAELLERVGLGHLRPETPTSECSVAVQQLVEIAKALSQQPRVLVFDEPTATLGTDEVELLFRLVERLCAEGVAIVWITHRLPEIARVAHDIVVLRDGRRVGGWDTADVPTSAMVEAMVGRTISDIYPEPATPGDEVVLEVEDLSSPGRFEHVGFQLHRGEILGIAGLVGAGRSELVNAIAGAEPAASGTIRLDGTPVRIASSADAVRLGVVLVPEDRRERGLAMRLTIADNVGLPRRGFLRGIVRNRELAADVARVTGQVALRGHPHQLAQTLSGGNQQKGVIAKWLLLEPRVIVFDEPTRGIDVGAKRAIYDLIHDLAARGAAVVVVSSELPEVLGIANRILVLARGRQTGILPRAEFSERAVMSLAVA
ncbi:sugar ABC transporter ATP-binding protein [Cellulomonas xiejunii]|uniref:Sugar ABC transporter ATP-binding protein n=1 Tax=Cellulomonas xiejunii TaxID=2968083 RepID=A0ABY5KPY0_9CELL|nr:sugar ABC transporter ATP-binding protein [Cellulomonas xiejunii]MCC2315929.1 sugar ABC transporter ATP-binding protein [Cellulomonas xiejunii]MCC2320946.1 sugar ABC transporter ATP-binding protein [Cellulomonas xiejunii]UUI71226.1 sugar ABC transporter ATP-binding protein [Cellulomonas xiejunii]